MTPTWIMLRVEALMRRLASILFLLAAIGCSDSGKEGASAGAASIPMGSLVCLDGPRAADGIAAPIAVGCPSLVVDTAGGDSITVLPPSRFLKRLPAGLLRRIGRAPFADSMLGMTREPIDRMIPPSANPGVLVPVSDYGLIVRHGSGGRDTLYPEDWPALAGDGRTCVGWEACLDSLQAGPWAGFLQGPFLPPWRTSRARGADWRYETGQVMPAASDRESGYAIRAVAKPPSKAKEERPWLFLHAAGEDGADIWVWRVGEGRTWSLQVPFLEQSEITDVDTEDIDGDGNPEILVRTGTHYGDGSYTTLYPLKGDESGNRPVTGAVEISGVSGEPGGSEVEGTWWVSKPTLYLAKVRLANAPDSKDGHDLRIEAFRFTEDGTFVSGRDRQFHGVLFASPMERSRAEALADSLKRSRPEAARAGLRPLPRRSGGKILWQPGAVAPDSATAETWSKWGETGRTTVFRSQAGL